MKFIEICKKIIDIFYFRKNDPVHKCKVYLNKGCSHVDGILCDFLTCNIRLEYQKGE